MVTSNFIVDTKKIELVQKRSLIRKPMSMVQYWVNTGKQPYSNYCASKNYFSLESESFFAKKCLRQTVIPSYLPDHSSEEKLLPVTKCTDPKVTLSSDTSIDTAGYILTNNNESEKVDSKGLDNLNKEMLNFTAYANERIGQRIKVKSSISSSSKQDNCESNINTVNTNINPKSFTSLQEKNNFDSKRKNKNPIAVDRKEEEIILFNKANSINKNLKNTIYCKRILQENSTLKESNYGKPLLLSESDMSIIKNKICKHGHCDDFQYNFMFNSELKNNGCRLLKRKKLYHSTESPVEFTPVSDTSFHQEKSKLIGKCDHPALQTPKVQLKPRSFMKYQRIKFKKIKNRRLLQSLILSKDIRKSKSNLSNKKILNSSNSLIEPKDLKTDNITVNFQDNINHLIEEKYKLKPLSVTLYKLKLKDDVLQYSRKNSASSFEISTKNENLIINKKKKSSIIKQNNMCVKKSSTENNKKLLKTLSIENLDMKPLSKYISTSDDFNGNYMNKKTSQFKLGDNSLKIEKTTSMTYKELLPSYKNKNILINEEPPKDINEQGPQKQTKMGQNSFKNLSIDIKKHRYIYNDDESNDISVRFKQKKNDQIFIPLFDEKKLPFSLTKTEQSQDENKFESIHRKGLLENTLETITTKINKTGVLIDSFDEDIITPIKNKKITSLKNNANNNNKHIYERNSDRHTITCLTSNRNSYVKKKNEMHLKKEKILKFTNEKQNNNKVTKNNKVHLNYMNINRNVKNIVHKHKNKKKKLNSEQKNFQFGESSDEDCIIPLNIK